MVRRNRILQAQRCSALVLEPKDRRLFQLPGEVRAVAVWGSVSKHQLAREAFQSVARVNIGYKDLRLRKISRLSLNSVVPPKRLDENGVVRRSSGREKGSTAQRQLVNAFLSCSRRPACLEPDSSLH